MSHPLDDAYVRLNWAMKRLTELKSVVEAFIDREHEIAEGTIQINPQPGVPFQITRPESPIPGDVPVLLSEVIQHLRSALDYLVFQLAILDSGAEQKQTQFPIENSPNQFGGQSKSRLKGLNTAHIAAIEKLQPYNGVNWTRLLRDLSNPDKHRHLSTQIHNTAIELAHGNDPTQVFAPPGVKGLFIDVTTVSEPRMYVQFHVAFFIAFEDGTPVIDTLEQIQAEVANVLADFKPEFK